MAGGIGTHVGFKLGATTLLFALIPSEEDKTFLDVWNDLNWITNIFPGLYIGLITGILAISVFFERHAEDLRIIQEEVLPEEEPVLEEAPLNPLEEILDAIGYSTEEIPINHCCPISHSIMHDPVIAYDGHTYNH
jgi:hypothetical protein